MRFTPAADRAATVNDLHLIPTMKLNGLRTAAHTARTESKSGKPGAISRVRARRLIRRIAARVLDRAADEPRLRRQPDRLRRRRTAKSP
jgi:hypothetical protein